MMRPTSARPLFTAGKNLVERDDDCLARTERELKREIRARHFPRHRDCGAQQPIAHFAERVILAEARR
jgi:hypothetical protein